MDTLFYSEETGLPFMHCRSCHLPLQHLGQPFLVSKSFHRGECVFEYALCEDCRAQLCEEFSDESQEALARFFQSHVDLAERSETLHGNWSPEAWIARCSLCRTPRLEAESYSIGGLFLAHDILFDPYPLCFCGKCEDIVQDCLSQATRGAWDDFVESHFEGPPANLKDLPVGGKPLLF